MRAMSRGRRSGLPEFQRISRSIGTPPSRPAASVVVSPDTRASAPALRPGCKKTSRIVDVAHVAPPEIVVDGEVEDAGVASNPRKPDGEAGAGRGVATVIGVAQVLARRMRRGDLGTERAVAGW
jgi:hypothetical protein